MDMTLSVFKPGDVIVCLDLDKRKQTLPGVCFNLTGETFVITEKSGAVLITDEHSICNRWVSAKDIEVCKPVVVGTFKHHWYYGTKVTYS